MDRWRCAAMSFILAGPLSAGSEPEEGPSLQGTTFLLEDAYNQEAGVLQHLIKGFSNRKHGGSLWNYSQEWPIFNASHQLELGISTLRPGEGDQGRGFGDAYLGYQYQLFGGEDEALAGALALTLTLPTGDHRRDRGNGAVGYEVEFPLSIRLSEAWGAHTNMEVSFVPGARNGEGERADLRGWAMGQSLVWYAGRGFHLILEGHHESEEEVAGPGLRERERATWVSPGLRWSHTTPGGIQIAPGIAFPVGVGSTRGEWAVLVSLCVEHPFRRAR